MSKVVKSGRISNKLILFIILFSSLLTLLITLTQLYFEYKSDLTVLNENIENVEAGYRQGITNAVWLDDKKQLTAILNGIIALPDVEYAAVYVNSELYAFSGRHVVNNSVESIFPLEYEYDNKLLTIGETFIEANLSGIYEKLVNRVGILLVSNGLKTFFVALFMYFLFDRLVFRRLDKIYDFVHHHDINKLDSRIDIEEFNSGHEPDEIYEIATSLNAMQEQLSSSLNELLRLKTTLDLSLDAVIMFYPGSYKFFYVNTGAAKLLGYSVEDLIGMTPVDICSDFDETHFSGLVRETLDDAESSTQIETVFSHKDGSLIPVKVILQYIDPENEEPRFTFIARDITKRKNDEMMLLKSLEDASAASEAKSKFLMSMSHELRTPLNAILGFSQLLEFEADVLTPNQNEAVKEILQGGRHLLSLIEDVLDLSSIESGNVILSLERMEPKSLVDECVKIISPLAAIKGVQLKNKISSVSLPEINIDQARFKQVLINLLSNAVKYNEKGGSVTLVCEFPLDYIVRFKITDTGCGIKASEQVNVFTPFNRLGHEAGEVEGTGIGLNITKSLVELMNGEIGFQSSEGKGSSFWVDFPRKKDNGFSVSEAV